MRSLRNPGADWLLPVVAAVGVCVSFWWSEPVAPTVPQPSVDIGEHGAVAAPSSEVAEGLRIVAERASPTEAPQRSRGLPLRRTWAQADEDDDFDWWLQETQRDRRRGGLGRVRDTFGAKSRR